MQHLQTQPEGQFTSIYGAGQARGHGPVSDAGYALLLVMMTVTLLLVALTVRLPSIYMEAQREREEELIFRGNEYAHAIALFHNRFGRYPNSVDELLKKTNGVRFLRRAYKDPMTKDGKWRFIHANGAGALLDSKTIKVQSGGLNATFGANQAGSGNSSFSLGAGTSGSTGFGLGSSTSSTGAGAQAQAGQSIQGQSGQTGAASANPGDQLQGVEGADLPENTQSSTGMQTQPGQGNQTSSFFGGDQTKGAFIAGVASTKKKRSIRVWNDKKRYDEWEFLGLSLAPGASQMTSSAGGIGTAPSTGFGPQPNTQNQPAPSNQPAPQNPQTAPPFGIQPGQQPAGSGQSDQSDQSQPPADLGAPTQ